MLIQISSISLVLSSVICNYLRHIIIELLKNFIVIMANEYEEIFIRHPQLVLVSRRPVTWRGFLKINDNTQMEIRMKVPNYPQMKDVSIKFGRQIYLMHGTDFATRINVVLNNATSVLSLLNQMQRIMDNILKEKPFNDNANVHSFNTKSLEELRNTLDIPGITVFVDRELSLIKLKYRDVSLQIKQDPTNNHTWIIVASDLPQLKNWDPLEKCVTTLVEAANTLKTRANALENTWQDLRTIDENCWVIDPIDPKPCHLYRRIHLNSALSVLITLNPLDPESLHGIKILGSDNEVSKYQNIVSENLHKWSSDRTTIENLLALLDISELPRAPNTKKSEIAANIGIVRDEECCICFCLELEDREMPSEVCNNGKCQRVFHTSCLSQWLAAVVGNQIVFDRIHGTCPNCNECISCPIVSN